MFPFSKISHRFSTLPSSFYSFITPEPLVNCHWVVWNRKLASQFDLPANPPKGKLKRFLCGEAPYSTSLSNSKAMPLAMKYAGHQFGTYNPNLGDGRGVLLGELICQSGHIYDLHLKGCGKTPYSRSGDGRASLSSVVGEYLCSEAMAGLGIPTTRTLGILVSDTVLQRDQPEQAALLLRLARSHVRFGHFEYFFYSQQHKQLKLLADKVIEWYWPDCNQAPQPYVAMFENVVSLTAKMIAYWQAYGFTHGVMNTDNMSILGESLDYGAFGFLGDYNPSYVSNHSDYEGRYAFDQQPRIALWNLTALAHSLTPLIDKHDLERVLAGFEPMLTQQFSQLMRQKLGLNNRHESDPALFSAMFGLLNKQSVDYTRFLRELSSIDSQGSEQLLALFEDKQQALAWLNRYLNRCAKERNSQNTELSPQQRCAQMRAVNPTYILRDQLVVQAIDNAQAGDFRQVHHLAHLLRFPFEPQPQMKAYE